MQLKQLGGESTSVHRAIRIGNRLLSSALFSITFFYWPGVSARGIWVTITYYHLLLPCFIILKVKSSSKMVGGKVPTDEVGNINYKCHPEVVFSSLVCLFYEDVYHASYFNRSMRKYI